MSHDINSIIQLLLQLNNNNTNSQNAYNDPFIDGIHRNFPDLLYNNARFVSVQSVMEYINHQMHNNYNVYNRNFANYWNARPQGGSGVAPAPPSTHSADAADLFSQLGNDITEGARMLNSLSNATTHTQTPVDSPVFNGNRWTYMDDEILLQGMGGAGINPATIPITPPRTTRRPETPPPVVRRGAGAREIFRHLIPDFLNFTEPALFMASARTYRVHPLNELNEINEGLTQDEINRVTHIEVHSDVIPERDGECPICFDDYSGNDLRVINNCNHAFHSECIERWFTGNRTCPICRANVGGTNATENPP